MKSDLLIFKDGAWQGLDQLKDAPHNYQLLLLFGDRELMTLPDVIPQLAEIFISAKILSATSAGEIYHKKLNQQSIVCIAIQFQHTHFQIKHDNIRNFGNSYELGKYLAASLDQNSLRYVMIISDGNLVNGDELAAGINEIINTSVHVSGFMSGDGTLFERTLTGVDGIMSAGNVILLGLYGDHLSVSSGTKGGWSFFGPERTITKSVSNELIEIDGENALSLYKRYLGPFAEELPGAALLFPIALLKSKSDDYKVRTILSVNHEKGSMTFAGNVPEGSRIRLMRTNTNQIINMAGSAAADAVEHDSGQIPLALIFNCIGRRLVLNSRANEEIKSIVQNFSETTTVAGLYSYGEFSNNHNLGNNCELHNQTVVVTIFNEY